MQALIEEIERDREYANLSSGIRVFALQFYKDQFDRPSLGRKAHWESNGVKRKVMA